MNRLHPHILEEAQDKGVGQGLHGQLIRGNDKGGDQGLHQEGIRGGLDPHREKGDQYPLGEKEGDLGHQGEKSTGMRGIGIVLITLQEDDLFLIACIQLKLK